MAENIYKVVRKGGTKPVHGKAYFSKGHATLSSKYNHNSEVKAGQVVWDGEGEVIISLKEYEGLKRDGRELSLLHLYGVDNWGYYYEAINDEDGYGADDEL